MPVAPIIVGAGLSGAVVARQLAEAGQPVRVLEARDHVGGNCHTTRDAETGVMLHVYGPHIFHTGDDAVWAYVNRFARFRDYRHRVLTTVGGRVYSMPINLLTINQFFDRTMSPDEARAFVAARATPMDAPQSFEDQALSMVGSEIYKAFFKGYTEKQWGCSPTELPAAILKRLPLRFSYDDGYFAHPHQGIPEDGYTAMVEAMLDHPDIDVALSRPFAAGDAGGAHVFWSGPLDGYFDHALGRLGYRTLDFEHDRRDGDFQGCPVMNYGDRDVPHTRITEHKHFAPWEEHDRTLITHERSRACGPDDIPYYPIRLVEEKAMLARYVARAEATQGVTFMGRLATYRYLDMDVCIREALDLADSFLAARRDGRRPPIWSGAPL
ncbi:MAG: UDP-galactopyranose mutase [Paracoccaceae bacterium]